MARNPPRSSPCMMARGYEALSEKEQESDNFLQLLASGRKVSRSHKAGHKKRRSVAHVYAPKRTTDTSPITMEASPFTSENSYQNDEPNDNESPWNCHPSDAD